MSTQLWLGLPFILTGLALSKALTAFGWIKRHYNLYKIIEELGISYINLYDPSGKTSNSYGVIALPATFFIDKNGSIAVKHYGSFLDNQAKKAFKSYLKDIME